MFRRCTRHLPLALLLAAAACDSKKDGAAADPKVAASTSKSDDGKAKAAPAKADAEPAGATVDVTMSSGQQLQGKPSECTLDAAGKGLIVADGGNFRLQANGSDAQLTWKHAAGDVEMTVTIMAKEDGWIRINGLTDAGAGIDGQIRCRG